MRTWDAIVVGAGAAGLSAAAVLGRAGARVLVLEARGLPGGRIRTLRPNNWPVPVELGAEFVHGASEELLGIARAGRLLLERIPNSHFELTGGRLRPLSEPWRRFESATRRMRASGVDRSVGESLDARRDLPPSERKFLGGMVEGFEAAPLYRISEQSLSTADSPSEDDADRAQFRFLSGYDSVIRWLWEDAVQVRCHVRLATRVRAIAWRPGRVDLRLGSGERLSAKKVLVTVPVGVLQEPARSASGLAFDPEPPALRRALSRLAMGHAVRVALRFREPFWRDAADGVAGAAYFHASALPFPTWWTAAPVEVAMLTGWVGGPRAYRWAGARKGAIADAALQSLESLFSVSRARLRRALLGAHVHDWARDPFARGAYSYALVGGASAPETLGRPIERTLYFAGEATGTQESGTVQSAIRSGRRAARLALG